MIAYFFCPCLNFECQEFVGVWLTLINCPVMARKKQDELVIEFVRFLGDNDLFKDFVAEMEAVSEEYKLLDESQGLFGKHNGSYIKRDYQVKLIYILS